MMSKLLSIEMWFSTFTILSSINNIRSTEVSNSTIEEDDLIFDNNTSYQRRSREIAIDNPGSSSNNIRFSIADLNVKHKVNGIDVNLEAFKVEDRERNNQWVSIGQPTFLKNKTGSIYQFNSESIILRLELLPEDQEKALKGVAKKLNPKIQEAFIHLIPLQSITCKTEFYSNGDSFELQGRVQRPNQYQVTIKVPCWEGSEKRRLFNERIQREDPLEWDCVFIADGKEKFINRLDIAAHVIQGAAVDHDLFGPNEEIYVTRKQMTLFSQKIRNELQIDEDYEFDEKFDEKVVEQLISVATASFQFVPIDEALEKLSKFGFSMSQKDLEPDEIKRRLSDEMNALKLGNRHSSSVKSDTKQANEDDNDESASIGGDMSIGTLFAAKVNGEGMKKNRRKWDMANMSAKDQLDEINKDSQMHTKFEWDGTKIVPKSVKVALLHKNFLSRNIAVSYRKIVRREARYRREIPISTGSFIEDRRLNDLVKQINSISLMKAQIGLIESRLQGIINQASYSTISNDVRREVSRQISTISSSLDSVKDSNRKIENRLSTQEQKKYFNKYRIECSYHNSYEGTNGLTLQHCPDTPDLHFMHSVTYDISGEYTSDIKFPAKSWKCCRYVFYSE